MLWYKSQLFFVGRPGHLSFFYKWSRLFPSTRSRKPTPSPNQGSPLQWVAGLVSPPRSFSLVLHRELKGTAGGPAVHCQGFSCTLREQHCCSETVPPNCFKLGAGLFYSSFSFTCKTLVAVAGRPFSLPSHQDMRLSRSTPGCFFSPGSPHHFVSCSRKMEFWAWVALSGVGRHKRSGSGKREENTG